MRVQTAIALNAVLVVAWIVAPPPVLTEALTPAPEMQTFFTVAIPRHHMDCYGESPYPDPPLVRWLRFERDATRSLRGMLANEAFLPGAREAQPVIYLDAADDVTWGEVMASIDLLRGKLGPETRLAIARPGDR